MTGAYWKSCGDASHENNPSSHFHKRVSTCFPFSNMIKPFPFPYARKLLPSVQNS